MEYVALLRGINVGGTNKVVMSDLREQIAAEGLSLSIFLCMGVRGRG